jgi:hypothetical protein
MHGITPPNSLEADRLVLVLYFNNETEKEREKERDLFPSPFNSPWDISEYSMKEVRGRFTIKSNQMLFVTCAKYNRYSALQRHVYLQPLNINAVLRKLPIK